MSHDIAAIRAELAPTGTLRAGLNYSNFLLTRRDAAGKPGGIACDIAGEIARRIGAPKAVRAVARACATNPVAVAIPCHRVVRRDGAGSGYRWGAERKRALLEREAP